MRKNHRIIPFFLFLSGCAVIIGCRSSVKPLPPVEPISSSQLGELVRHSETSVILLNVWATWCDPCMEEIPELIKLRAKYRGKGLETFFISVDDADEIDTLLRPTLGRLGVDFLTYISSDSSDEAFIQALNPKWNGALPTTFIYRRGGELAEMFVGKRTYASFEEAVVKLF